MRGEKPHHLGASRHPSSKRRGKTVEQLY